MNVRYTAHTVLRALAVLACAGTAVVHAGPVRPQIQQAWQSVKSDYGNFYTGERWTRLGIAFSVGGVMANTHIDQSIRDWYQDNARGATSDHLAKDFKNFGEVKYLVPLSLAITGLDLAFPQATGPVGAWGQRTLRAYLVAGPAMAVTQRLTGASRPEERHNASHWRPLQDSNGVSGHAFVGAVPFMTAAQMSDNPYVHYGAYAASALTAWSRIHSDAHFTSQALLGWYMAYEATDAVSASARHEHESKPHLAMVPWGDGALVEMGYQW